MVQVGCEIQSCRSETAAYCQWLEKPTKAHDIAASLSCSWLVPEPVLDCIPRDVLARLGCDDGKLRVLRDIDIVDVCAGRARVTCWARHAQLQAVAIDRAYGEHLDICTEEGFAIVILLVLRIKENGLMMAAPQCSSWIWINKHIHKRKRDNVVGDTSIPTVVEGNMLNQRVALLAGICSLNGVHWMIEQPGSSQFFQTACMTSVIEKTNAKRVWTWLGAFGHPSPKPTLLYGTAPFMSALRRSNYADSEAAGLPANVGKPTAQLKAGTHSAKLVTVVTKDDGTRKVTGSKQALQLSQVYPACFALEVVKLGWPEKFNTT